MLQACWVNHRMFSPASLLKAAAGERVKRTEKGQHWLLKELSCQRLIPSRALHAPANLTLEAVH